MLPCAECTLFIQLAYGLLYSIHTELNLPFPLIDTEVLQVRPGEEGRAKLFSVFASKVNVWRICIRPLQIRSYLWAIATFAHCTCKRLFRPS